METLQHFTAEEAFDFGRAIVEESLAAGLAIGVDIYLNGRTVFRFLPSALGADKEDWLCRKRNTVLYFGMSTQAMYEKCKGNEALLQTKYARELREFTLTPGSLPLVVEGTGLVGALTVTGLLPEEDHALAEKYLRSWIQNSSDEIG